VEFTVLPAQIAKRNMSDKLIVLSTKDIKTLSWF